MEREELEKFCIDYWRLDKSNIKDKFLLTDENLHNFSSIGFYKFMAAIESNFNVEINDVHKIKKFGQILEYSNDTN